MPNQQERWKQTGGSSIKESCLLVSSRTNATPPQGPAVPKKERASEQCRPGNSGRSRGRPSSEDPRDPMGYGPMKAPGGLGLDCLQAPGRELRVLAERDADGGG
ncbi:hypothetical protein TWF718_003634 [Orbilia javanica]|uniref:Uncharacterized protein n=1 Tax=Orbilia javanica TaxID=47235 RepID=A0AAN8N561_9PEZI